MPSFIHRAASVNLALNDLCAKGLHDPLAWLLNGHDVHVSCQMETAPAAAAGERTDDVGAVGVIPAMQEGRVLCNAWHLFRRETVHP